MVSPTHLCSHCGRRVWPTLEGKCPNCKRPVVPVEPKESRVEGRISGGHCEETDDGDCPPDAVIIEDDDPPDAVIVENSSGSRLGWIIAVVVVSVLALIGKAAERAEERARPEPSQGVSELSSAATWAREAVKQKLAFPETAETTIDFGACRREGSAWLIRGSVRAKNAFGVPVNYAFGVRMELVGRLWNATFIEWSDR
jgi:hypothetical protein